MIGFGVVIIANDRIEIDIRPDKGGALDRVHVGGHEVFRSAWEPGARLWNPIETGCFPLVPFSNRIEDGRFVFGGQRVDLSPNMGNHPHAIHGQGWLEDWHLTSQSQTTCELEFDQPSGEWPWSYMSRQKISLAPDGFRHDLSIENTSPTPMPAGLGIHPQLVRTPTCRLTADTDRVWLTTSGGIPTELVPVPPAWDLSEGKSVAEMRIDNCFAGWNGTARITWPEFETAMVMQADDPFDHLVVYIPVSEDFFCVEPVSHMPNAVNQPNPSAAGLVTLEPGRELSAGVTFRFEDL